MIPSDQSNADADDRGLNIGTEGLANGIEVDDGQQSISKATLQVPKSSRSLHLSFKRKSPGVKSRALSTFIGNRIKKN